MFAIGALAIGCLAVAGSGESNKAESVSTSAGQQSSAFKVGDNVKLGDWVVTVNSVQNPYASDSPLASLQAGEKFVAVDATVQNNGSKPATVSSLACFDLADSTGKRFSEELGASSQPAPNGEVAPGEKINGLVVFAVPETASGLQLKFKCDLLSSGTATIDLG